MFDTRFQLPGVFLNNPYKGSVNGSLWTLRWEVICYLLLMSFSMLGLLKNKKLSTSIFIVLIFSILMKYDWVTSILGMEDYLLYLPMYFLIGCIMAVWKNEIYIDGKTVLGLALLSYLLQGVFIFKFLLFLTLFSFVVVAATSKLLMKVYIKQDISYGIYIYGFLIQQILAYYYPNMNYYMNCVISIFISSILGYLSFVYIEHPNIILGKRIQMISVR